MCIRDRFFSALEIKCCPSCNHQVVHSSIGESNTCPLCHEVAANEGAEQKHNYSEKAKELEETLEQMMHEKKLLEEKKKMLNNEIEKLEVFLESIEKEIMRFEKNNKEDNLDEINRVIEKIENMAEDGQEKDLICLLYTSILL